MPSLRRTPRRRRDVVKKETVFETPGTCHPLCLQGGFLPEPRPIPETKPLTGQTLVKLASQDDALCLAATNSARGVNPLKHCRFWDMIQDKMLEGADEDDPMQSTLQGPTASPESARRVKKRRRDRRHQSHDERAIEPVSQIEVPEKFGSDVTRLISVSHVDPQGKALRDTKAVLIDEADLPWAVEYLRDEYMYAGVPDATETFDSPPPSPRLAWIEFRS